MSLYINLVVTLFTIEDVMSYDYNPSNWEAESERLLSMRLAYATWYDCLEKPRIAYIVQWYSTCLACGFDLKWI